MTELDLATIHARMTEQIVAAGGRIDEVIACPHLSEEQCSCRKPRPGMALNYLAEHPEIDGSLSVMVGDTDSDIAMGRAIGESTGGCRVIRIDKANDASSDATYASLAAYAATIC